MLLLFCFNFEREIINTFNCPISFWWLL